MDTNFVVNDIPFSYLEDPLKDTEEKVSTSVQRNEPASSPSSLEEIEKVGLRMTDPLPMSPRNIAANVFKGALAFIKNAPVSILQLLKKEKITALNTDSEDLKDPYLNFDPGKKTSDTGKVQYDIDKLEANEAFLSDAQRYCGMIYKGKTDHRNAAIVIDLNKTDKDIEAEYNSKPQDDFDAESDPEVDNKIDPDIIAIKIANDKEMHKALVDLHNGLIEKGFERDYKGVYYHLSTGTMLSLSSAKGGEKTKKREIVLCFWGLGNEKNLGNLNLKENKNWKLKNHVNIVKMAIIRHQSRMAAIGDFAGKVQPSALQAVEIGKLLEKCTEKTTIKPVVVGHSHGGGLAMCAVAGTTTGIKGYFINARPMGSGIIRKLGGIKEVQEKAKNSTAISVEGDFLTDSKILNKLSGLYEKLTGIGRPRVIGQGCRLPLIGAMTQDIAHGSYDYCLQQLVIVNNSSLKTVATLQKKQNNDLKKQT